MFECLVMVERLGSSITARRFWIFRRN